MIIQIKVAAELLQKHNKELFIEDAKKRARRRIEDDWYIVINKEIDVNVVRIKSNFIIAYYSVKDDVPQWRNAKLTEIGVLQKCGRKINFYDSCFDCNCLAGLSPYKYEPNILLCEDCQDERMQESCVDEDFGDFGEVA